MLYFCSSSNRQHEHTVRLLEVTENQITQFFQISEHLEGSQGRKTANMSTNVSSSVRNGKYLTKSSIVRLVGIVDHGINYHVRFFTVWFSSDVGRVVNDY